MATRPSTANSYRTGAVASLFSSLNAWRLCAQFGRRRRGKPGRTLVQEHSTTAGFVILCRKPEIVAKRQMNTDEVSPRTGKTLKNLA
jgi:hypothetical protein